MWLHATIAGPSFGIRSSPSCRSRNHRRSGGSATILATWYQGSVSAFLGREVVRVPRASATLADPCVRSPSP
jgi:hypothetical protein